VSSLGARTRAQDLVHRTRCNRTGCAGLCLPLCLSRLPLMGRPVMGRPGAVPVVATVVAILA